MDNSNVWIEGMHVAAVESGLAPDIWTAQSARINERWSYDFGKLLEFAGGDKIGRAVLYGSRPPPNDSIWTMAERAGFEVVVYDRNAKNKEKKIAAIREGCGVPALEPRSPTRAVAPCCRSVAARAWALVHAIAIDSDRAALLRPRSAPSDLSRRHRPA